MFENDIKKTLEKDIFEENIIDYDNICEDIAILKVDDFTIKESLQSRNYGGIDYINMINSIYVNDMSKDYPNIIKPVVIPSKNANAITQKVKSVPLFISNKEWLNHESLKEYRLEGDTPKEERKIKVYTFSF